MTDQERFDAALKAWLEAVTKDVLWPQVNQRWSSEHGQTYYTLVTEPGQKFIRIVANVLANGGRSAWAFVAKDHGMNKNMGSWEKGDIFKPASWKAPAPHARGNIFNLTNGPTCGIVRWTGPEYLR